MRRAGSSHVTPGTLRYVLVGVSAPSWLKAAVLVTLTLVLSLTVSALFLKRTPALRRVF
jgi:hypothetical protein